MLIYCSGGDIMLTGSNSQTVSVRCRVSGVWNYLGSLNIISESLTLEEIYEIDRLLGQSDIEMWWCLEGWGFLSPEAYKICELSPETPVKVEISSSKMFRIPRQDFIKRILEPADMLRRVFLEVVVEPINKEEIEKISNANVRESLKLLLRKQEILQECLEKLAKANKSSEYKDVIINVRQTIEGITKNSRIFNAIEEAFKSLSVLEEVEQGALEGGVKDLLSTINDISKGLHGYSCVFTHTKTFNNKKLEYKPKPYRHDAEFAVLEAMIFLNYLIKVLKIYAQRL